MEEHGRRGHRQALVTGASSGLGESFAEQLAWKGYDLILVARRKERLERIADRIRGAQGVQVEVLAADLTQPEQLELVEKRLANAAELELLVNNAATAYNRTFSEVDVELIEETLRLKVLVPTRLVRVVLPVMLRRNHGAIINVSSVGAYVARPGLATYAAANSYLSALTKALVEEVRGTEVYIQELAPSLIRTEMAERGGMDLSRIPAALIQSPEAIVHASLVAFQLGETVCFPTLEDLEVFTEARACQLRLADTIRSSVAIAERYGPA